MTREKEIREASIDYQLSTRPMAIGGDAFADDARKLNVNTSFIAGAEWADAHPHWISVKDELPEACVTVLTTTQHGTQSVGCYEDGWWLANSPNLVRMGSITHWMPLPAPPTCSEKPNNCKKGGEK